MAQAMTAKVAKMVDQRYQREVELVEAGRVYKLYGGREGDYIVTNGEGTAFLVNLISGECTCPDSQYRCAKLGIPCKHTLAVELLVERQQAGKSPAPQPAASCAQCGAAIEAGRLCAACEASARALLAHL